MLDLMQLRYFPRWLLVAMETPLIYPYRTILSYRLPFETLRPHAVPCPPPFRFRRCSLGKISPYDTHFSLRVNFWLTVVTAEGYPG